MTGISENDRATSDDFSNSTSSVGTFSGKLNWMWIEIECIAAGGENWQWYLGSWWVKIHLPPWNNCLNIVLIFIKQYSAFGSLMR